jgi:hypothetical protein
VDWLLERILSQSLNDLNDLLNRLDHNLLCVIAKHDKSHCQNTASENSGAELEDGFHS